MTRATGALATRSSTSLAWFDHWLKGIDTGITDTATPLHLEDLANGHYANVSRYPLEPTRPTTSYLHPGSALSPSAPASSPVPDPLVFTGTQSYTTAPFTGPTTLAGPIGATLCASSTTADTEFVVQLSDIAPDGNATALTSGLLEGNQRALEPSMTWGNA